MFAEGYDSLIDFIREFPDDAACLKHLEHIRWGESPCCVHCGNAEKIYQIEGGKRYKCSACRKKFTALVGTIFENTKIPLQKWFLAMYFAINDKKGVSSCQLAKNVGITQKSAWFMLHRIREMLRDKAPELLQGNVEVDETYIGGKEGWKHQDKRYRKTHGRSTKAKTPVFGMVERETGKVAFHVVEDSKQETIQSIFRPAVKPGSTIHSDEWVAYQGLSPIYQHEVINHRVKEYVRGTTHTNTIENRWSHLRRTLTGTYHQVSRKHLARYANESAFRLNTRDMKGGQRFDAAMQQCEGGISYVELTSTCH